MGRKKKFIDKKKAATFQLLARDSSDPSYEESDRVFIRVDNNPVNIKSLDENLEDNDRCDGDSIFADAPEDNNDWGVGSFSRSHGNAPLPENVRKEILELGFPDDGYNYLMHLREIKNTGGGSAYYHNPKAKLDQVPRDVKAYDASRVQISAINEGNPNDKSIYIVASKTINVRAQKAVDPDVAALLDDSDLSRFGSDDEDLEEDFVVQANLPEDGEGICPDTKSNSSEQGKEVRNAEYEFASSFQDEERGHQVECGEDYVVEEPRARRLLDEQFDLLESKEYGSEEDDDDDDDVAYGGHVDEDVSLAEKLKHALNDNVTDDLDLDDNYKVPAVDVIQRCVEYAEKYEKEDEKEDLIVVEESSDESEVWDCETIVSTYSNLDNHPGKIGAPEVARRKKLAETISGALSANSHVISLRGKEKLPVDYLPHSRKSLTEKVKGEGTLRPEQQKRKQHGQESKAEKKERKAAVKEERRAARLMKKEMKELYKCEAQRAQRVVAISGPSSIRLM